MPTRSVNGSAFVVLAGGLAPETMNTKQVVQALQGTFRRESYTPPMLPRVALEILRLSQAPISMNLSRDVELLLAEDALLTARVLRAANAPGMGSRSSIRSIRQAVIRLGLRGLRDVVITVSLRSRIFRTPIYQAELHSLCRHSIAMGTISQRIAQNTKGDSRFAYLCGLLADLGIAASLLVFGELPEGPPPLFHLWPAMLEVHEEAAVAVGEAWALPEEVVAVIGAHHDSPSGPHAQLQATLARNKGRGLTRSVRRDAQPAVVQTLQPQFRDPSVGRALLFLQGLSPTLGKCVLKPSSFDGYTRLEFRGLTPHVEVLDQLGSGPFGFALEPIHRHHRHVENLTFHWQGHTS